MIWIVVLLAALGVGLAGARGLVFGLGIAHVPAAYALVLAAGVVVACQAVSAARSIHAATTFADDGGAGEIALVVDTLGGHLASTAWQAGLLVAAALLVTAARERTNPYKHR